MRSRNLAIFIVAIVIGFSGLFRFSQGIRSVNAVGLFASGAAVGAGVRGLVIALRQAGS